MLRVEGRDVGTSTFFLYTIHACMWVTSNIKEFTGWTARVELSEGIFFLRFYYAYERERKRNLNNTYICLSCVDQ